MASPDYAAFIRRIIETLEADEDLAGQLGDERIHFGDLPNETDGTHFPLIRVTTAKSPEQERSSFTPILNRGAAPGEIVTLEFHVIIVANGAVPETVQEELYKITGRALEVLRGNIQLRDARGNDPLCASSRTYVVGRLEKQKGHLLEAMTIRITPRLFTRPGTAMPVLGK